VHTRMNKSYSQDLVRPQMPELDTLRGLAILGVVFYHGLYEGRNLSGYGHIHASILKLMALGQSGVALFFVLSGFLITGLLLDSRNRVDYYRRFYIRRALRILPAYYAILLILAITRLAAAPFLTVSLFYCSNFAPLLGLSMAYPVLWSLAVEEHFYLIWPAAVHRLSDRRLLLTSATIVVVAPLLRFLYYLHGIRSGYIALGFDHYTWNAADGLACGAILAMIVRASKFDRRRHLFVLMAVFGLTAFFILTGVPYGIGTRSRLVGAVFLWTVWNLASAGLVVLFQLIGTGPWKRIVVPRVLLFFGEISYGLYLIHLLIFWGYDKYVQKLAPKLIEEQNDWRWIWLRFAVAGSLAVIVAYLSRRFFEEPFLRLKDRLTTPERRSG
jgi:peptidoglycan/LPS O-acetylase OafA/YrhL